MSYTDTVIGYGGAPDETGEPCKVGGPTRLREGDVVYVADLTIEVTRAGPELRGAARLLAP